MATKTAAPRQLSLEAESLWETAQPYLQASLNRLNYAVVLAGARIERLEGPVVTLDVRPGMRKACHPALVRAIRDALSVAAGRKFRMVVPGSASEFWPERE